MELVTTDLATWIKRVENSRSREEYEQNIRDAVANGIDLDDLPFETYPK